MPAEAVDVILRDGGTLRLRAPGEADADEVVAFFERLSERSLYLRFHGARRVDARLAEPFLDPDWSERGSLVGTLGERIVALASYARLRDPSTAEIAFVVADSEQGRGIGTRLLEQLAGRAGEAGIDGSWPT
ncbi:MAG TPA: GNAT family N-acetyltransferase [Gaiellaceae bacterium]